MYNNKILVGVLSAIIAVLVVFGILFGCGVFKSSDTDKGTKLPICYPDKDINWMSVNDDKTFRASFNDVLTLENDKTLLFIFDINNLCNDDMISSLVYDKSSKDKFAYDIWVAGNSSECITFYVSDGDSDVEYNVTFKLYNNAALTEAGDITAGEGFVLEVGNLKMQTVDSETSEETYIDVEITSVRILSMYQEADNNKVLQ